MKPRTDGFTLIELALTLCLFALLAAIASARFRGSFEALRGDAAMRDILSATRLARSRAILESIPYGILFSPLDHGYRLVRGDDAPIAGQWGELRPFSDSLAYDGPETSIHFYPDGGATESELYFDGRGRRLELLVNPATGKGTFHEVP